MRGVAANEIASCGTMAGGACVDCPPAPRARFRDCDKQMNNNAGNGSRALWAVLGIGILLLVAARPAHAADGRRIFRFRDAHGVLQVASVLPPDRAQAGYEILDADTLRTLAVVAPTPTDGERAALEAQQRRASAAEQAARQAEQTRQHEMAVRWQRDRMLLQTYASEADLLALRDAKLESLRLIESSVEQTIGYLRANLARLDASLDEQRQAGRTPASRMQAARDRTAADLAEQQQAAARLQADRAATGSRFEDDLRRYRELTAAR